MRACRLAVPHVCLLPKLACIADASYVASSPCSVSRDLAWNQINKQENQSKSGTVVLALNYPQKHDYSFLSLPNHDFGAFLLMISGLK